MIKKSKVKRSRLVDFYEHAEDYECALLGAFGFSNKAIERSTGLNSGRIWYRLKMAGIERRKIRDGNSDFSKLIYNKVRDDMDERVMAHIRKHL